jgi:hypothetical protein
MLLNMYSMSSTSALTERIDANSRLDSTAHWRQERVSYGYLQHCAALTCLHHDLRPPFPLPDK